MDRVSDGDGGGSDNRTVSRGRGRNSWGVANPSEPPPPLRRPNSAVTQPGASLDHVNEMFTNVSIDVVKNSPLSATAAEFVPRNLPAIQQNQMWPRPSVQDRLSAARNQPMGQHQQHQPQYGNQQYPYHMHQVPYQSYVDAEQTPQSYPRYDGGYNGGYNQDNRNIENNRAESSLPNVLSQLNTAMQTLTRNPDQFENLVVPLVSNITPHLKHPVNTQAIVSAIILKSISDSNFRYSGARLCSHLDSVDTPVDDTPSIFRKALYDRCREETETQGTVWPQIAKHSPEDEKKCHGLMLCLAELVAQMEQCPASVIGKLLVEVISIGLKNPGPNSAKFICQSLKLSGQHLERDSATNRQEIERIMRELAELVIEGRVDAHVGRMVTSVQELRNGNWGRNVSSHGPAPAEVHQVNNQPQPPHQFDEPVFYGPDGELLTAEEQQFCEDLASSGCGDWSGNIVDAYQQDEEDMIAEAYEEFLMTVPTKPSADVKRG